MKENKTRPVNLDLQTIELPIPAIASIIHRISGVITFVAIGILLYILNQSLSSSQGFEQAADGFLIKFILWGILTALAYHVCVGIRHLMMDMGHFEELESGVKSAKVAFIATAILSVLAGVLVW